MIKTISTRQNLRAGYKHTEVGVIPEEWEIRDLGAQATFRTGPFGSALHKSDYTDDGIPIVNPMHIIDSRLVSTRTMTVTEEVAKQLVDFRLRPDDIIIGRRGDMGRCAVVQEGQKGWLCGTGSMIIRCGDGASPDFLQRVLSSPRAVKAIEDASVGSTMINLNQSVLSRLRIQFPPSEEQRAVAGALADVDALLGALDHLIAKKHDLKQAVMQGLLTGRQRLPGFLGDWEESSLQDTCIKIQDGTHFSPILGGNDFLYITSKNIGFGTLDFSTAGKIDATEHAKIYSRCDVIKGDLLLTKDGVNTGNAALNPLEEPFSLLSSVALLRFDSRRHVPAYFLYQILSQRGQQQIKALMSGNAITRLTLVKIRSLRFPVPSIEEQHAVATVLSDMDAEIATLKQRRDKTHAVKQGMMQDLLTGRIRLV